MGEAEQEVVLNEEFEEGSADRDQEAEAALEEAGPSLEEEAAEEDDLLKEIAEDVQEADGDNSELDAAIQD